MVNYLWYKIRPRGQHLLSLSAIVVEFGYFTHPTTLLFKFRFARQIIYTP